MTYYPQSSKGFAIDHDLASHLNILDELLVWEEEYNDLPLVETFEKKFGVEPNGLKHFEYAPEEYIQGFDCELTYILFDEDAEKYYPQEWKNLINILEDNDVDLIEGSWGQLE